MRQWFVDASKARSKRILTECVNANSCHLQPQVDTIAAAVIAGNSLGLLHSKGKLLAPGLDFGDCE